MLATELAPAAQWMASEDGRRLISRGSERWRDANIASGTDAAVARSAADRATAAYTGPAPTA